MAAKLLKTVALLATVALLSGLAPRPAQAAFTRVVDLETRGGYTAFDARVTVWYESPSGKGFVRFEKRFHSGESIVITDQLERAPTIALWWDAYNAAPWSAAQVKARFLNVDVPDTVVTYMGRYTQTVRADPSARSLRQVSQAMQDLIAKLWDLSSTVSRSNLFRYEGSGGLAGYHEVIQIDQDGKIVVETSYLRQGGTPVRKEGNLTAGEIDELHRLCAGWWSFPASFEWPGGLVVMDGITYTTSYSWWGYDRDVRSKTAAQEDPAYEAILAKVHALAGALNP